ncbi:hypothetical protein ACGF5F_32815 [Streptomyces sp. NPDC047821]|uniref:hypothetical protein n=1 Tax=Streptomyces sp. NPDC047821 TaxID=3365488 RepID=UPI0037169E22
MDSKTITAGKLLDEILGYSRQTARRVLNTITGDKRESEEARKQNQAASLETLTIAVQALTRQVELLEERAARSASAQDPQRGDVSGA